MLNSAVFSLCPGNFYTAFNNSRNNVQFSGKNFSEENLFGETILIPRAVHDAKESSRIFAGIKTDKKISMGNAVYLGDDIYLTADHLFEAYNPNSPTSATPINYQYSSIGKLYYSPKSKKKAILKDNKIEDVIMDYEFDLALAKVKELPGLAMPKPLKIAKYPPKRGETVYILGKKLQIEGIKAIPATYEGQILNKTAIDIKSGKKASFSQIKSDILEKNGISSYSFSGAPVVNKKGELVGIFSKTIQNADENKLMIDLDTIIPFLRKHNISVNYGQ